MTLRDLGVFEPLKEGHPGIGMKCWICDTELAAGTRVALKPCETPDQTGSLTVESKLVCGTCYLKGETIMTEGGMRIVERVKDGNGSPYPVITTDGLQWSEDEVTKVQRRDR